MPITLDTYTFDAAHTTVKETHREVGGRKERLIELAGLVAGKSTVALIEAELDAILDAASKPDYSAALSIRAGRRLFVRRDECTRQIARDALVGSFVLRLLAKDPFEESIATTLEGWAIAFSGAELELASQGSVYAKPIVTFTAVGDLVNPSLSDGVRALTFNGVVPAGSVLVVDGVASIVLLDGDDVTPYTSGEFPRIEPEGTTLRYEDDASSSHSATAVVEFRDRWW